MYCRVAYIENPWYDDHFDIPTERQRIGKTLTTIAAPGSDLLSRGSLLIGWALYEKLDEVLALMARWHDDSSLSSAVTASAVCSTYRHFHYLQGGTKTFGQFLTAHIFKSFLDL